MSIDDIILEIFTAFGGQTALAGFLGEPVSTVDSWKGNGNIPRWRKPGVLQLAESRALELSDEAWAYLRGEAVAA